MFFLTKKNVFFDQSSWARGARQTHFGTFNFWSNPFFFDLGHLFHDFETSDPGCQPLPTHF